MSDDEEVDETEEEEEEEEKTAKSAPAPKKGRKFNPDDMGKVMGKVGVADIYDLFVFAAGLLGIIIFIIKFTALSQSKDYWLIVYYALSIWVYVDTALATKLGPWLASKFKSTSSAFSFLRDETDAKNFVVIIGAWTTVLG
ncbi:MAG TPA: hypothetical protein VKK79_24540, partial [Candidatus Lokiarchaeia archaeon]|nr:hypothetical protein [Candidatus Lokiarchaeia archaeon]